MLGALARRNVRTSFIVVIFFNRLTYVLVACGGLILPESPENIGLL